MLPQIMETKSDIKKCDTFIDCRSEKNNAQVDNAKDNDVVMPIYDSIQR